MVLEPARSTIRREPVGVKSIGQPDAVLLVTSVSADILGGVKSYVTPLANGLVRAGIAVRVVYYPTPLNLLESRGLPRLLRIPLHLLFVVYCVVGLLRLRSRHSRVIVHTHGASYALLISFLSKVLGHPSVHTFHSVISRPSTTLRLFAPRIDALIFVSKYLHRWYFTVAGVSNGAIHYLLGAVDTNSLVPLRGPERERVRQALLKEFGLPDRGSLVTFIGRIVPVKGVLELVEAIGIMREMETPATVLIVGPPLDSPQGREYHERILQRIDEIGLRDWVAPIGPVVHPVKERILSVTDVFTCPSLEEAAGLVVAEALSSGCPVVASNVGGIPELVSDGETGILVRVADPRQLASAVHTLVTDGARRTAMGAEARKVALERFSPDSLVARHLEIYANQFRGP